MMQTLPKEVDLLEKLVAWGNARPSIRAMILTSSRARPDGPVELLSDYDVILAVTEADRFGREDDWLSDYGQPMVRWGDQSELYGLPTHHQPPTSPRASGGMSSSSPGSAWTTRSSSA